MKAIENLRPEQQAEVRAQVRALLERTSAFHQLDVGSRRALASGMVDVVSFLADPAAGNPEIARRLADPAAGHGDNGKSSRTVDEADVVVAPTTDAATPALAQAMNKKTGADKVQDRLAKKQNLVGKDYEAGALKAGTESFRDMVGAVDFPEFVSGLIEGVFTSIVDSSIRQMEAYGKLLEAVVKSVEEYAADHVTLNQARDYLQERFPDTLTVKIEGDQARLAMRDNASDEGLEKVRAAIGAQGDIDLDDETSEAELARRAQLEMARLRQQQLSTMVLLGINRIVVTDGLINAKVVFDMRASDVAQRTNRAAMFDDQDRQRRHGSGSGWLSTSYDHNVDRHKTVVTSSTSDESESKAQIKANLTGEVRVNFKSETFPLERMASTGEIESLNERSRK